MDQETEAPADDLEATDDDAAEGDLGDGGYTPRCGTGGGGTVNT